MLEPAQLSMVLGLAAPLQPPSLSASCPVSSCWGSCPRSAGQCGEAQLLWLVLLEGRAWRERVLRAPEKGCPGRAEPGLEPGRQAPSPGLPAATPGPGGAGGPGGVLPAHSNAFPAWPLGLRLLGALTPRRAGMADGHLPVRSHLSSACPGPDVNTFIASYRLGLVLSGWGGVGRGRRRAE